MNNLSSHKAGMKNTAKNSRGASRRAPKVIKKKTFNFPKKTLLTAFGIGSIYLLVSNFNHLYEKINTQKIEHIVIEGSLDFVSEDEVKVSVFRFVNQSLVGLKLEEIKLELEKNPWIKAVAIKRQWPDTIIINVSEELAIARWGNDQLLNQEGELFSPLTMLNQTHLSFLSGPAGSEQKVMEQYQEFNQLLYPHGLRITKLDLNSRDAWTIELEGGVKVKVGKDDMKQRVQRFVDSIAPMFVSGLVDISSVDLRYNNGIAVKRNKSSKEEVVSL